ETVPAVASLGLSAEVAEAAGLAHDLGHPPFGHIAESELDKLTRRSGGFEGNAQTFRIVTCLSKRTGVCDGLNLSVATLNALLKYPWLRVRDVNHKRFKKWGIYESEREFFTIIRN